MNQLLISSLFPLLPCDLTILQITYLTSGTLAAPNQHVNQLLILTPFAANHMILQITQYTHCLHGTQVAPPPTQETLIATSSKRDFLNWWPRSKAILLNQLLSSIPPSLGITTPQTFIYVLAHLILTSSCLLNRARLSLAN